MLSAHSLSVRRCLLTHVSLCIYIQQMFFFIMLLFVVNLIDMSFLLSPQLHPVSCHRWFSRRDFSNFLTQFR